MLSPTYYHTEDRLSSTAQNVGKYNILAYFHSGGDYEELGRYILGVEDVIDGNALRIMVELLEEHKPDKFLKFLREFVYDNYEDEFEDWMDGNAIGKED